MTTVQQGVVFSVRRFQSPLPISIASKESNYMFFEGLEFMINLIYCLIGGLIVSVAINIYLWWKYIKGRK